jgi:hypothetical protein
MDCPKCGSKNIGVMDVAGNQLYGNVYYCEADDCSYYWIPRQQAENQALRDQLKDTEMVIASVKAHRIKTLWNTCLDCGGDKCTHGADYDPIMQAIKKWEGIIYLTTMEFPKDRK